MKRRLLGLMLLCGCATPGAVRQASEDHACDADSINVLDEGHDTVLLDVCGQTRQYRALNRRYLGPGAMTLADWLDVTNLNQMPPPKPRHVSVNAEPFVRDPGPLCTANDVAEMRAAHVSESAIASACKS